MNATLNQALDRLERLKQSGSPNDLTHELLFVLIDMTHELIAIDKRLEAAEELSNPQDSQHEKD